MMAIIARRRDKAWPPSSLLFRDARATSRRSCAQTRLTKHGGVIPVNALACELVAAELHDYYDIHGDLLRGRRYVRQEPRHWLAVGEREVHFIYELAVTDNTVHGRRP